MNLHLSLAHVFGIVKGIVIPGESGTTANLSQAIHQSLADAFGAAAKQAAIDLSINTNMSGPDKAFAIAKGIVETAKAQGFKGEVAVLEAHAIDVAAAAYRATVPNIDGLVVGLAAQLTGGSILAPVASLVGFELKQVAEAHAL